MLPSGEINGLGDIFCSHDGISDGGGDTSAVESEAGVSRDSDISESLILDEGAVG